MYRSFSDEASLKELSIKENISFDSFYPQFFICIGVHPDCSACAPFFLSGFYAYILYTRLIFLPAGQQRQKAELSDERISHAYDIFTSHRTRGDSLKKQMIFNSFTIQNETYNPINDIFSDYFELFDIFYTQNYCGFQKAVIYIAISKRVRGFDEGLNLKKFLFP